MQEPILKYDIVWEGEMPTLCCFDLEKAFDSIEYPVLLNHCSALESRIKLMLASTAHVTGIKMLSGCRIPCHITFQFVVESSKALYSPPPFFITIMDSLLKHLKRYWCYIQDGWNSECINSFCAAKSLKLNSTKTFSIYRGNSICTLDRGGPVESTLHIAEHQITYQLQVKLPGHRVATPSLSLHIGRREHMQGPPCFFATGSLRSFFPW